MLRAVGKNRFCYFNKYIDTSYLCMREFWAAANKIHKLVRRNTLIYALTIKYIIAMQAGYSLRKRTRPQRPSCPSHKSGFGRYPRFQSLRSSENAAERFDDQSLMMRVILPAAIYLEETMEPQRAPCKRWAVVSHLVVLVYDT